MNPKPQPEWIPIAFAVVFPIFWCLILFVISFIGGWRQLAKRYRCNTPVTGTTWRCQSAGMRHLLESSYGSCLKVTANDGGIGLSVLFPFRFGHPPLFIPWSDVLVSQVTRFIFFKRVRFTFPEEPSVWFELSPKLAEKIQKAVGQEWFGDAE